jgi:predicted HTH domain antitoxin
MTMTIRFDIPGEIEEELSASEHDLGAEAREVFLVNLYREDRISHHQLARALGMTRLETEGLLKRYGVSSGPDLEDLLAEIGSLREVGPR